MAKVQYRGTGRRKSSIARVRLIKGKRNGIDVEICQCRISEIASNLDNAVLIVPTSRLKRDFGIPIVPGTAFISGVGTEKVEAKILKALKDK